MEQVGKRNDHQMILTNQPKNMGKACLDHMAEDKIKALAGELFGYKLETVDYSSDEEKKKEKMSEMIQ